MDYLVSIIINNYNYGRFLNEAIGSALNQTIPACEIVVVDDGSTDNSRDVILAYGDRVNPVFQENRGQRGAYNTGFKASKGDLILFLDADDMLEADMIETVIKAWQPGAAKLHFPLRLLTSGNSVGGHALLPISVLPEGDLVPTILRSGYYNSPPASGNVYSRRALNNILPLDEDAPYFADMHTIYLSPFYGQVLAIRRPLGTYRVHDSNHTTASNTSCSSIRNALRQDHERIALLSRAAAERGLAFDQHCSDREFHHLKLRLSSLRLDPASHPVKTDTRVGLVLRAMRATLSETSISIGRRFLFSMWFVAISFAPQRTASGLIRVGLRPASLLLTQMRRRLPFWRMHRSEET